jgi:hypothetical protein
MANDKNSCPTEVRRETTCRNAIIDLCKRTRVISYHGKDLIPIPIVPLLESLTKLGMERKNLLFLRVLFKGPKDCTYEPALRGGFHRDKELDAVNRVQMSVSHITKHHRKNRVIVRPSLADNEQGAIVVIDGLGSTVCIVALNALSNAVLLGRKELVDTYQQEGKLFWTKGCSLSGNCNYSYMDGIFRNSLEVPRQFGIGEQGYIHGIIPWSKKAKVGNQKATGCVKLNYENQKGENVQFQCGNLLYRCIAHHTLTEQGNPAQDSIMKMCGELAMHYEYRILELLKLYGSYVRHTNTKHRIKAEPLDVSNYQITDLKHAINRFESYGEAPGAIHQDSTVEAAAVCTAFVGEGELSSKYTHNAEGGQLFLEWGALVLPYGPNDAIIFCGNSFHAPMPPTPSTQFVSTNKKRTNDGSALLKVKRYSVASFVKSS